MISRILLSVENTKYIREKGIYLMFLRNIIHIEFFHYRINQEIVFRELRNISSAFNHIQFKYMIIFKMESSFSFFSTTLFSCACLYVVVKILSILISLSCLSKFFIKVIFDCSVFLNFWIEFFYIVFKFFHELPRFYFPGFYNIIIYLSVKNRRPLFHILFFSCDNLCIIFVNFVLCLIHHILRE